MSNTAVRPEVSSLENEIKCLNLPRGITLAKGFEKFPNLETIRSYIKTWTYEFVERLIAEAQNSETNNFTVIDALSGSLLLHYLYLDSIKDNPQLKSKTKNIYAVQIPGVKTSSGQDSKRHLISDYSDGDTRLIDDIVDTAVSSGDIENTVNNDAYRMRALSYKSSTLKNAHPLGNGNIPYHVFDDEWIATCFGMNSGLGDTEYSKSNEYIRARMYEISILERTCCLPLALEDRLVEDWGEEEVQQYIDTLRSNSIFQNGEVPTELANMYNHVIEFKSIAESKGANETQIANAAENLWQKLKIQEAVILKVVEA